MGIQGKNTIIANRSLEVVSIKDFGLEKANPEVDIESYCDFQKGTCETPEAGEGSACQDQVTIASASSKNISGGIFNGFTDLLFERVSGLSQESHFLPVSIPLTEANQDRINAALDLFVRRRESRPCFLEVVIDDVADEAVLTHIGHLELTEVTFSNVANESTTRLCNVTEFETFTLSIVNTDVNADPNLANLAPPATDALANAPYTADAAGATSLEGDIATSLVAIGIAAAETQNLSVTFNATTGDFDITMDIPKDSQITLASVLFVGGGKIREAFTS